MSEPSFRAMVEHPFRDIRIEKRLLLDPDAEPAVPGTPAFAARPAKAKPYHGFPLIEATRCEGYCFGAVTDFLDSDSDDGCTIGDAFVEAPDGTRAGLVWSVEPEAGDAQLAVPDTLRWGVYFFSVLTPIGSEDDMVRAFAAMVPVLKQLHVRSERPR